MRISVKDDRGDTRFALDVPLDNPPTVIRPPGGAGRPMTLQWDRALDDKKHLRHCVVCGCPNLYTRKPFPQVTTFTLVILAALIAMVLYGFDQVKLALGVLVVVLLIDLLVYVATSQILTCYRCQADYRGVKIARGQQRWESAVAEKYRRPGPAPRDNHA